MALDFGKHVRVDYCADRVALVELHAPPHNFANVELIRSLADAFEALDRDTDCRAVVLAASGKTFCAGADLGDVNGLGAEGMQAIRQFYDNGLRIFSTKKPIVAAVQGAAVGAGLGLALVADFRLAAPEARFHANFVTLGTHPGFAMTRTLPDVVGAQRAAWMFLTGRRMKADEALQWGLVEDVVPLAELRERATALASEIAANAPLAVVATRATLRHGRAEELRAQFDREFAQQTRLRATRDYAEGVRAAADRRPADFTGS